MNDHDPLDLVDLYVALAELRATIGRTTGACLVCVAICELMVTLSAASVLALVFTAIALGAAVLALVNVDGTSLARCAFCAQRMMVVPSECGSELVRLEQLVLWAGGAPCPA